MAAINRASVHARFTQVLAGIAKHITDSVTWGGITYTTTTMGAPFQAWFTAVARLALAKAAYHAAVLAEQGAYEEAQRVWVLLQGWARVTFVGDTAALADFGFAARKFTKPSPAVEAAAIAKRKATREARHTMGPQAKLSVTGASPAPAPAAPPAAPPGTPPAK